RGALPGARGRALHRALLQPRPAVAAPRRRTEERMSEKTKATWRSDRLQRDVTMVRWGSFGRPVLLFPTAGGDAEEIERMKMVDAVGPLIDEGRIKLYSCDSVSGRAM